MKKLFTFLFLLCLLLPLKAQTWKGTFIGNLKGEADSAAMVSTGACFILYPASITYTTNYTHTWNSNQLFFNAPVDADTNEYSDAIFLAYFFGSALQFGLAAGTAGAINAYYTNGADAGIVQNALCDGSYYIVVTNATWPSQNACGLTVMHTAGFASEPISFAQGVDNWVNGLDGAPLSTVTSTYGTNSTTTNITFTMVYTLGSTNVSILITNANLDLSAWYNTISSQGQTFIWNPPYWKGDTFVGFNSGNTNEAAARDGGNTAIGCNTLAANTSSYNNTAVGDDALMNFNYILGAGNNTAIGFEALQQDTTGIGCTAIGANTLAANTSGYNNTAVGDAALMNFNYILGAGNNTAIGFEALQQDTTGIGCTALGAYALNANITANYNTGLGYEALYNDTIGDRNVAVGSAAFVNLTTGSTNIGIGCNGGVDITSGSYNIDIGDDISGTHYHGNESDTIRIGTPGIQTDAYIAGVLHPLGGVQGNLHGNADAAGLAYGLPAATTNAIGSYVFNGPNNLNVNNDPTEPGTFIAGGGNAVGLGSDHSTVFDFGNVVGINCNDAFVTGEQNQIINGVGWSQAGGLNNVIDGKNDQNNAQNDVYGANNTILDSVHAFIHGANSVISNANDTVLLGKLNFTSGADSIVMGENNQNHAASVIFLGYNNKGLLVDGNGLIHGDISTATNLVTMTANRTATVTFNTSGHSESVYNTSASTITSLTLNLPTATVTGQILRYTTAGAATTVTVNGTVSVGTALTTMTANSTVAWQAVNYSGAWTRIDSVVPVPAASSVASFDTYFTYPSENQGGTYNYHNSTGQSVEVMLSGSFFSGGGVEALHATVSGTAVADSGYPNGGAPGNSGDFNLQIVFFVPVDSDFQILVDDSDGSVNTWRGQVILVP